MSHEWKTLTSKPGSGSFMCYEIEGVGCVVKASIGNGHSVSVSLSFVPGVKCILVGDDEYKLEGISKNCLQN